MSPGPARERLAKMLDCLRHEGEAVDTRSSVSRQHFIDTGEYLTFDEAEALGLDGTLRDGRPAAQWRRTMLTVDGETWHLGFVPDPPVHWNGWACPAFHRHAVDRIMRGLVEHGWSWTWRVEPGGRRVLIVHEPEAPEPEVFEPDAHGRYALGAWSWTWTEVEHGD